MQLFGREYFVPRFEPVVGRFNVFNMFFAVESFGICKKTLNCFLVIVGLIKIKKSSTPLIWAVFEIYKHLGHCQLADR